MNNLNVQIKQPLIYDFVWQQAVNKMYLLAEDKGICNMVAAAPAAIEVIEDLYVTQRTQELNEELKNKFIDSYCESEIAKNRKHSIAILVLAMNACDLDESVATRFDRIEKAKAMRDSINEYIARLEK